MKIKKVGIIANIEKENIAGFAGDPEQRLR